MITSWIKWSLDPAYYNDIRDSIPLKVRGHHEMAIKEVFKRRFFLDNPLPEGHLE